jgi:ribose 5-phosphate isomerase B
MKRIVIGCDSAALELKSAIIEVLKKDGIAYEDIGVFSNNDDKIYPLIAQEAANRIIDSNHETEGILLCGTGIGMAIAANKFAGIYAAVCHDIYSAERARLSNDTNIITMGSRVIGSEHAKRVIKEWLSLEYKASASTPKVEKIKEIEKKNFRPVNRA